MRYTKLTLQYIFRHKLALFLYTIIPGFLLSFTFQPTDLFSFFLNYFKSNPASMTFGEIFESVTQMLPAWRIAVYLLALLFVSVFIAATSGMVERDMRLGDFKAKRFFKNFNNNFLSAFFVLFVYYVILELYGLLNASFIFLWARTVDVVPAFVMSMLTAIIFTVVIAVIFVYLSMWYPHMVSTGLRSKYALSQSVKAVRGNFFKIVGSVLIIVLPFAALMWGISAVDLTVLTWVVRSILYPVLFSFAFSYVNVLLFVVYFDVFEIEREDLNRKSLWAGDLEW